MRDYTLIDSIFMLPSYICSFFETHVPPRHADFVVEIADDMDDISTYSDPYQIDIDDEFDANLDDRRSVGFGMNAEEPEDRRSLDKIVEMCKQRTLSLVSV